MRETSTYAGQNQGDGMIGDRAFEILAKVSGETVLFGVEKIMNNSRYCRMCKILALALQR